MSDDFQNWRDALAGNDVALHADIPHPGYYKLRKGKDGPYQPVAIWRKDGHLVCRVAGEMVDPLSVWTWCADKPVSKDAAKQAFETGAWPGDVAIGHNSGDMSLADEIRSAAETALGWLSASGIRDKVTNDIAANHKAKIWDLHKRAKAEAKDKKAPYEKICDEIDDEYTPLITESKAVYDTIGNALTAYMTAEQDKARKAAAEAARIENEKRMAEYQRQQEEARKAHEAAIAASKEARANEPPPPPPVVEVPVFVAPAEIKVQAGGQRGKKVSLRETTRYRLSDYAAALAHVKDHPDVIAAVEKVACAQARAGATVPGVESFIERKAV